MAWLVSTTNTAKEQNLNKDIDSQTGSLNALFGRQIETGTEETNTQVSGASDGGISPFYLCPNPTCKHHVNVLGDIVQWKLRNASPDEYSIDEIEEIADKKRRQSIRDYRTVTKNVEKIYETIIQDSSENDSSTKSSIEIESSDIETHTDEQSQTQQTNTQEEETPLQQLDPCKCGERQDPEQTSIGETTTEEQSVKDINRAVYSLKSSVEAIPFVSFNIGGRSEKGDETTNSEKSNVSTTDTAIFPLCQDSSCKERLTTLGLIECWEMRNDSSQEFSDKEIDEAVKEVLEQEVRANQRLTENAEVVFEEMVSNAQGQGLESSNEEVESSPEISGDQEPTDAISDSATETGEQSADTEAPAASAVTNTLYEQLDGVEPVDEGSTVQTDVLDDKIAAIGTEFTRIENGVAELEANPNIQIKSSAKQQQLLDQLEAMTTRDENTEAQIDQLTESVTAINPQQPQADAQLDLFTEQVANLEANDDIHTDLAAGTVGHPEIQQLDSRLDAIDADDAEIIQRRDSLKQDVDLLDRRYARTTENIAELDPDQDTHADQTTAPDASEGADEATTSEDSESPEATGQGEETITTGQTNGTDTPESDGGPPADEGSDNRGGESETDTEEKTTTVEPESKPAQATADASTDEAIRSESDPTAPTEESQKSEETVSDGAISDRLTGTNPSNREGMRTSNNTSEDNDDREKPDGMSP